MIRCGAPRDSQRKRALQPCFRCYKGKLIGCEMVRLVKVIEMFRHTIEIRPFIGEIRFVVFGLMQTSETTMTLVGVVISRR